MYALVDCNNFYASCERVFQPQFVGKPVAILSNNDGCVISRSNEAKAVGVPMGAPAFQIKELVKETCQQGNHTITLKGKELTQGLYLATIQFRNKNVSVNNTIRIIKTY